MSFGHAGRDERLNPRCAAASDARGARAPQSNRAPDNGSAPPSAATAAPERAAERDPGRLLFVEPDDASIADGHVLTIAAPTCWQDERHVLRVVAVWRFAVRHGVELDRELAL